MAYRPFAADAGGSSQLLIVRALLDGVEMVPGPVQFSGDDDEDGGGDWARSHNHQWVAAKIPFGAHTVTIEYRSFFGGTVFMHNRTLTVKSR